MKTIKLLALALVLAIAGTVQAQVTLRVNIGSPPQWGPVGYTDARYYYLPDVEAYYDVQSSMFIYYNLGRWVHRSSLPSRYRNYDLYGGYKVVMSDYHGNTPYTNFREHRSKYARGFHGESQKTYGERPGRGYQGANRPSRSQSIKMGKQDNKQSNYRSNDKNQKRDNGNSGGKGKKR